MKTTAYLCALACALLLLTGCGLLSPEQQGNALLALDQMLAAGSITQVQYEALREGVLSSGAGAWWEQLAGYVLAAGAAYVGVQIRRGPPTRSENVEKAKR